MGIRMIYRCDGCDEEDLGSGIRRVFNSFSGRGYGFGTYQVLSDPQDLAPQGWIAFDSVGATYCPSCAEELFPRTEHAQCDVPGEER